MYACMHVAIYVMPRSGLSPNFLFVNDCILVNMRFVNQYSNDKQIRYKIYVLYIINGKENMERRERNSNR